MSKKIENKNKHFKRKQQVGLFLPENLVPKKKREQKVAGNFTEKQFFFFQKMRKKKLFKQCKKVKYRVKKTSLSLLTLVFPQNIEKQKKKKSREPKKKF